MDREHAKTVQTDNDSDIDTYECTMDEQKYLENTLYNYFYLKQKELDIKNDIRNLEKRIEEEKIYIKGYNYENDTAVVGNGCSVSYKRTPELDSLTRQLFDKTQKARTIRQEYRRLDEFNRLTSRIYSLSVESQIIIYDVFRKGMRPKDVATREGVTTKTIDNRIDKALKELMQND